MYKNLDFALSSIYTEYKGDKRCIMIHLQNLLALTSQMKIRDVIKMIETDGWYQVTTKGSHRQYKHPTKPGRVTIAGHPSHDLAAGTLNSVLKQAQLKKTEVK